MQRDRRHEVNALNSPSGSLRSVVSSDDTEDEFPPNDPVQLIATLKEELRRLSRSSSAAEEGEAARSVSVLLKHAHTLAWRGVAQGDLELPGKILSLLRQVQRFVDLNAPKLPAKSGSAAEIRSALTAFFIAHESLAEVRSRARLADRERSQTEREVLRVLAESPESYLRRGQVRDRLSNKPSSARVGQVLIQLSSEGLLKRIQSSAQGNPETSFYGLSPLGHEVCVDLQLLVEREAETSTAEMSTVKGLFRNVFASPTRPDAQVRQRIALGLFSQVAYSPNTQHLAQVALVGYKVAQAQLQDEPERAEHAFLVCNCLGANLAASTVVHPDERGSLALTSNSKGWDRIPEELLQPPAPIKSDNNDPEPPPIIVPRLSDDELDRLFSEVIGENGEFALLESYEEALQQR